MERNEGNSFGSVEEQVWNELENLCHTDKDANYTGIFNDSQITTIFFQTGHMKKMLNRYPEMLFIDTKYFFFLLHQVSNGTKAKEARVHNIT